MLTADGEALRRLVPYLNAGIAAQDVHVADQLDAAVRDGQTWLRFDIDDGATVWVVVVVGGVEVCKVDLSRLLVDPVES